MNTSKKNIKKKILILGASSDIGKCVIDCFVNNGYEVYAHHNKSRPKKKSKNIHYLKCNFENHLDTKKFLKKINRNYFCSFVNLIGFIDDLQIQEINYKTLIKSLDINFINPVLIANEISKKMVKNNFGRLLHCSSIGVKFGGGINSYSYSLAKHCLEFIPQHFKNVAKFNLLYNVLRIGVTDTKIHKKLKTKNLKIRQSKIPIKRLANPKEIAEYIFYLSSENNTFISNQVLSISGGE